MVIGRNSEFIALATDELRARELGPFEVGSEVESEPPTLTPERSRLGEFWARLPMWLRGSIAIGGGLLGVSLGAALEGGGFDSFTRVLIANALIAGIIGVSLAFRSWIDRKVENGWISWACGLVLLFAGGALSQPWTDF
jgi:hypothetical protein